MRTTQQFVEVGSQVRSTSTSRDRFTFSPNAHYLPLAADPAAGRVHFPSPQNCFTGKKMAPIGAAATGEAIAMRYG